ncbi:MAG: helix-turn-helix transcriptional regulator [Clostridia bacterium]|nr:helix-turn-helix transcriptional regulator [Clostridia bacterium]
MTSGAPFTSGARCVTIYPERSGLNKKPDPIKTGAFLQSARKRYSLTQAGLAEKLGVSPQSVSNWERGEAFPDVAILPDLAYCLHCSVDAILSGGAGCGGFRRHITVAQMQEALAALDRVGELLGRDHFIYRCIIEALDTRMNTNIEGSFSDPHIFDVFTVEFLLACIDNGDYVDPQDVRAHLPQNPARAFLERSMEEHGIR